MKLPILLGLLLIGSTFAAEAPKVSASVAAARNIAGQVGVMVAEVEDALGYDQDRLEALAKLGVEIGAVAKTVGQLVTTTQRLIEDQQGRVNAQAAKHKALSEELAVINGIVERLEVEVMK